MYYAISEQNVSWTSSANSEPVQVSCVSAGLYVPAGFSGATITFQRQFADGTWKTLHNASGAVSVSVTADTVLTVPDDVIKVGGLLRVVSASSETAVGKLLPRNEV